MIDRHGWLGVAHRCGRNCIGLHSSDQMKQRYGSWYLPCTFFLELATRCEYKAVLTFTTLTPFLLAMRLKHLKRVLKYEQRVWNIWKVFWMFATLLKHLKRVLNIGNAFEWLATRFEYEQRTTCFVSNTLRRDVQNTFVTPLLMFQTRCKHSKHFANA